jgi:hypothetical protein
MSKFSNWSAQSSALSGMQAKEFMPFCVSNTLLEKQCKREHDTNVKVIPFGCSINNVLVNFSKRFA